MNDITREDAVKWLTNLRNDCGRHQDMWHYAESLDQIIELLSADAVPVVRCKDCKRCHRFANDSNSNMKSWCLKFSLSKRVNDDDFCAWGERKDNE